MNPALRHISASDCRGFERYRLIRCLGYLGWLVAVERAVHQFRLDPSAHLAIPQRKQRLFRLHALFTPDKVEGYWDRPFAGDRFYPAGHLPKSMAGRCALWLQ